MPAETPPFVHLHLHSEYSLLDGGNTIDRLVKRVKEMGMDAVAVTDHGNMYGAVEFYAKAKAAGVKPILGIEAYVAPGDRQDKTPTGIQDGGFHLVLLAENEIGWRNLLRLSSDAFLKGFYYRPRMDKSTLARWSDGLIAINGHLGSSIAHHLLQFEQTGKPNHWDAAVEEAIWHRDTFGTNDSGEPRFFVELQMHDVKEQRSINPHLVRLARELDLPLVGDNDAHFLRAEDWDTHDSLCCISMGKTKDEADRLKYSRELYVKSPEQMRALFQEWPEAYENTAKIAARCRVDLDFSESHAPVVRIERKTPEGPGPDEHPRGSTEWFKAVCETYSLVPFDQERDRDVSAAELKSACDEALRELCEAGLVWRYGEEGITGEIRARLDRELTILADKEISAYFLIVWDFVNWARQQGIPANARGSGVGTMVGYVLGLSNACPERYGLLFERFTDPDRREYPDIDVDMCQDGRADVINYVREKYGHVAQIITFGRLKARQAIKDVARVMGFTPGEGQRLSNLVPAELNITIDEALEKEPDLRAAVEADERVKRAVETAKALEGQARHAGVHAAGVVIATQPLDNIVPLCKASGSDEAVTQWDGPTCEKVGLLKMDFLGLRTLSTIERCRTLIRDTLPEEAIRDVILRHRRFPEGVDPSQDESWDPLDLERLRYDDQHVLELFRRGDTMGIFQFESGGMRKLLVEMQPDRLEDLIAANALYRPGPMDLIPNYNNRKHGREEVPKVHPIVDGYTAETYGIMVYQEQVMQIVHALGDIPLRAAYTLIKAISKKKKDVIDQQRPKFIEGAQEKGLTKKQANDLFELILKFAGYGFNKSHSTGYAIIAYQTAYLKTYFPNQYMAALLSFESQARKVEDWVPYLESCRDVRFPDHAEEAPHAGVTVAPPDLNRSAADFTVVFDEGEPRDALHGHVRFGLGAIRGAGNSAIGAIVREREANGPFESLFDFCERVDLRAVNKATLEALVKCGAFDAIHGRDRRAALLATVEDAMRAGQAVAEDRRAGQMNFFGSFEDAAPPAAEREPVALTSVPAWTAMETLQQEKEVLGFHVSGHPLDLHRPTVKAFASHTVGELLEAENNTAAVVAAMIAQIRTLIPRGGRNAGQKMAILRVMDKTGSIEAVAFSEVYAKIAEHATADALVFVIGKIDRSRGEPNIVVEKLLPIADAPRHLAVALDVKVLDARSAARLNGRASERFRRVKSILESHASLGPSRDAGGRPLDVFLHVESEGRRVVLRPNMLRVAPEDLLLARLRDLLGEDAVRLRGGRPETYLTSGQGNGNGSRFGPGARRGRGSDAVNPAAAAPARVAR